MPESKEWLYCVDDDAVSNLFLESIFENAFECAFFSTPEAFLKHAQSTPPALVLLDVDGTRKTDGFEICHLFKALPNTEHIPVLFVSRNEATEARLTGYEAGGEDFILKPYAIDEVRHRIQRACRAIHLRAHFQEEIANSETLTNLLLSNMDEYAVLIQFMRALNESADENDIANALLAMLERYRLQGAAQIRLPWKTLTLSKHGMNRPLEISMIEHLSTMERIFSFQRHSVYNFEHLTLLVNDMPVHDPDMCGRLRDHLAIAVEVADAKVRAQIAEQRFQQSQNSVAALVPEIQQIIGHSLRQSEEAHREAAYQVSDLLEQLEFSFTPLGMSKELEEEIIDMVRSKARVVLSAFTLTEESNKPLKLLETRMKEILI